MDEIGSGIKMVLGGIGGIGLATVIKWLHGEISGLKKRVHSIESTQAHKIDEGKARQLIQDLNEPLKRDLEYIKKAQDAQVVKMDKIIEKLNDRS